MKPEEMMDPLRLFSMFRFILIPALVSAQEAPSGTLDGRSWSFSLGSGYSITKMMSEGYSFWLDGIYGEYPMNFII